jgi:hypothetical protein
LGWEHAAAIAIAAATANDDRSKNNPPKNRNRNIRVAIATDYGRPTVPDGNTYEVNAASRGLPGAAKRTPG